MEHETGIEPALSAWKAEVLAIKRLAQLLVIKFASPPRFSTCSVTWDVFVAPNSVFLYLNPLANHIYFFEGFKSYYTHNLFGQSGWS